MPEDTTMIKFTIHLRAEAGVTPELIERVYGYPLGQWSYKDGEYSLESKRTISFIRAIQYFDPVKKYGVSGVMFLPELEEITLVKLMRKVEEIGPNDYFGLIIGPYTADYPINSSTKLPTLCDVLYRRGLIYRYLVLNRDRVLFVDHTQTKVIILEMRRVDYVTVDSNRNTLSMFGIYSASKDKDKNKNKDKDKDKDKDQDEQEKYPYTLVIDTSQPSFDIDDGFLGNDLCHQQDLQSAFAKWRDNKYVGNVFDYY